MSTATAEPVQPKGLVSSIAHAFDAAGDLKIPTNPEPVIKAEPKVEPDKTSLLDTLETPEPVKQEPKKLKAEQWAELKGERDKYKTDYEKLQAEYERAQSSLKDLDTYKTQAQRTKELEEKLEITSFERSDKFQRDYVQPRDAKISQAKEFAKDIGLPDDLVDRLLTASPKDRIKLLDETVDSTAAQSAIHSMIHDADNLSQQAKSALNNWKEKAAAMTAEERKKAISEEENSRKELLSAFDAALPKIAEKLSHFRAKDGDEDHNKMVAANISHAKAIIMGEASMEDMAAAPYLAVAAKSAIATLAKVQAENKALKERMAEFEDSNPKLRGGGDYVDKGDGKPKGLIDRTRNAFQYQ